MRIYLTGFMGTGKTAVGKALAGLLGWRFVDLDAEVEERAGMTIRQIFARFGEAGFRDLEQACLEATVSREDVVIAAGGGIMTEPRHREAIRRLGKSVWLNPSFATIVSRMSEDQRATRPLFRDEAQARRLFEERLDAYRKADLRIDISLEETLDEVAAKIAHLFRGRPCNT
jgi:shikimate kinase